MTKMKVGITAVIVIIFSLIVVAYFNNSLVRFGLCKPGDKIIQGNKFSGKADYCYTPSGFEGRPCNKESDCGNNPISECFLYDKNTIINKGMCKDAVMQGCYFLINENGEFNEEYPVCYD
jgi:hypothetical protein